MTEQQKVEASFYSVMNSVDGQRRYIVSYMAFQKPYNILKRSVHITYNDALEMASKIGMTVYNDGTNSLFVFSGKANEMANKIVKSRNAFYNYHK